MNTQPIALCMVIKKETMEHSEKVYKFLGISDKDVCDCCGRTNLKRTVALECLTDGLVTFFGVDCAAKAMKYVIGGKRVKNPTNTKLQNLFLIEQGKRVNEIAFKLPYEWSKKYNRLGYVTIPYDEEEQTAIITTIIGLCKEFQIDPRVALFGSQYTNSVIMHLNKELIERLLLDEQEFVEQLNVMVNKHG